MNPFVFDKEAPPTEVIDRRHVLKQMMAVLEGGQNVRLASPRRYGKTTLVKRLLQDLDLVGYPVAYVDLGGVRSAEEVLTQLEKGYADLMPVSWRLWRRLGRSSVKIKGELGTPAAKGSVELTAREVAALARCESLLTTPERVYRRRSVRTIVVFDEFQDLLDVEHLAVLGAFRRVISHHVNQAAYVFAGSKPGLLSGLFTNVKQPFFQQARPISLGPLPAEDLAGYLTEQFEAGNRKVDAVLPSLLALAQGHPQRSIYLAHYLWEQVSVNEVATDEHWRAARDTAFRSALEDFHESWANLSGAERLALEAIAGGREAPDHTVKPLVGAGHVFRDIAGGPPNIVDPLFAEWLVRRDGVVEDGSAVVKVELRIGSAEAARLLELLGTDPSTWAVAERPSIELMSTDERAWFAALDQAHAFSTLTTKERISGLSGPEQIALEHARRAVNEYVRHGLEIGHEEATLRVTKALLRPQDGHFTAAQGLFEDLPGGV